MFHLYFGAFDIILYLGAAYFAMILADAICDELEHPQNSQATETTQVDTANTSSTSTTSIQPSTPSVVAPRSERAQVKQQVTVRG